MARARILVDGDHESSRSHELGDTLSLSNDDEGGETTYLWTLLEAPPDSVAAISSPSAENPTITLDLEGTYIIRLRVNGSSALSEQVILTVRELETGDAVPGSGENPNDSRQLQPAEDDGDGYPVPINATLRRVARSYSTEFGVMVGVAGAAGLVAGDVVRMSTRVSIHASLTARKVPSWTKALATALVHGEMLGVLLEGVDGDTTPDSGDLIRVKVLGSLDLALSGSPSVGAPVFVSDTATISLTPGSEVWQLGRVTESSAGTYRIALRGPAARPEKRTDVRDFGAVADYNGSTGTDNRAAFALAQAHARTNKQPLYIPEGEYLIRTGSGADLFLGTGAAGEYLELVGDGSDKTVIHIGQSGGGSPMTLTETTVGFQCQGGSFVTFRGMSLRGATTPGTNYQTLIFHDDGGLEGRVTLLDVKTGDCSSAVKCEGNVLLEVDDGSELKAHSVTVLQIKGASPGTHGGRFHTGRCTFERVDNGFFDSQHCLYIDENISYRLGEQTTVLGCPNPTGPSAFAFHNFGSASENADYCEIAADFLGEADSAQILTNSRVMTVITSKTIQLLMNSCRGVWVRNGGATVIGTRFVADVDPGDSCYGIDAYIGMTTGRLFATRPIFEGDFGDGACIFRSTSQTRTYAWHIDSPVFLQSAGWPLAIFGGLTDQMTVLEGARFHGLHSLQENVYCLAGEVHVINCHATNGLPVYFNPSDDDIRVVFRGNRNTKLLVINGGSNTVEIFGDTDGSESLAYTGAAADVIGHLVPQPVTYDTPVSSAATITLPHGFQRFEISGTVTVVDIEYGDNGHMLTEAELEFVLSGACAFSAAGNVTPRHTAARTAGETVRFRRDPYLDKWVEEYSPLATGSPAAGSVLFAATGERAAADPTKLFWDAGNDRLAIGDDNPEVTLDITSGDARPVVVRSSTATAIITFFDSDHGGTTLGSNGVDIGANGDHAFVMSRETGGFVILGTENTIRVWVESTTILPHAHDSMSLGTDSWAPGGGAARRFKDLLLSGDCRVGDELEVDGNLNHDGSNVGFYGVAPVARSTGWTITNDTTDRTFDADAGSVLELADVVATLIRDLAATGIIGAVS